MALGSIPDSSDCARNFPVSFHNLICLAFGSLPLPAEISVLLLSACAVQLKIASEGLGHRKAGLITARHVWDAGDAAVKLDDAEED